MRAESESREKGEKGEREGMKMGKGEVGMRRVGGGAREGKKGRGERER